MLQIKEYLSLNYNNYIGLQTKSTNAYFFSIF